MLLSQVELLEIDYLVDSTLTDQRFYRDIALYESALVDDVSAKDFGLSEHGMLQRLFGSDTFIDMG